MTVRIQAARDRELSPAQEKELAAASRAAEQYIREHGVGGEPGHRLVYLGNSPEWQAIRDRLTRAMWPPAEPSGEQLGLFS